MKPNNEIKVFQQTIKFLKKRWGNRCPKLGNKNFEKDCIECRAGAAIETLNMCIDTDLWWAGKSVKSIKNRKK